VEHREFYVYIMSNMARTLYIGVTNNVYRRVAQHRSGSGSLFTARYGVTRLVYVESTPDIEAAIAREKQLKRWRRERKIELIEALNPGWRDLYVEWGWDGETDPSLRSG
jgi:putative endonuclease